MHFPDNDGNLDLPSNSSKQARDQYDLPYRNPTPAQGQQGATERLRTLHLPQPQHAYPTPRGSSPRVSSISSVASSQLGSQSCFTPASSSGGPKTPGTYSPTVASSAGILGPPVPAVAAYDPFSAMNQPGPEMYYQHMSSGPAPPQQTVTSYGHPQPLLQPGSAQYPAPPPSYSHYGYGNGITPPPTGPPTVSNPMGASHVLPLPGVGSQQGMTAPYQPGGFDTTGQVAPPGMKPRVTATLWEDEGSLCFQVEARGICVARREDNHMINGTKLLNVAGMTRGRRDGILKSEKVRHVVKIGPMHLKGVWIPFERALDFANKEKITELLYPLFVHNINALLYHPTNQPRTTQVMAAAERRKLEQSQLRSTQSAAPLPSLHHHSMSALPGPQTSLSSHPNMGRPSLDRAHTFPAPPTSTSGVMGSGIQGPGGGIQGSESFQWSGQTMNGAQAGNPVPIDTGLSNARSMPTTPATTPPGAALSSMQPYPPASQSYDNSRQLYSAPPNHHSFPPTNGTQDRSMYSQTSYVKAEMGPPASRPVTSVDQADTKPATGMMHSAQGPETVPQPGVDEEAEHEHDTEYTHDSGAYDAARAQYNYNPAPVPPLASDHTHLAADMAGSPHQAGRATPRTAPAPQAYYTQQGYGGASSRPQGSTSSLYNVVGNDRGPPSSASGTDMYAPQADMGGSMPNGYGSQQPMMSSSASGMKRGREDDDDRSSGVGSLDLKRRKTFNDGSIPSPTYDPSMSRASPAMAAPRRR